MNFNSANIDNLEVLFENQTLTADGAVQVTIDTSQYKEYIFTIRIDGPVTGTSPTIEFLLFDQDLFGISVTGNVTSSGVFTTPIIASSFKHITQTGLMQLNWQITGAGASFGGVYAAISGIKDAFITGQETMDDSQPVVIASDQSAVPISGSVTVSSGFITVNNAGGASAVNIQDGGNSITIDGTVAATQSGTWTVQQGTPPWQVVGNVASGATDSGNPVKNGAVFNTTQPTVTNGQRVDNQATSRGSLIVATGVDNFNINNISGTISLPTGAATSANQTTEIASLQIIDNAINAPNTAINSGVPIMGQLDDTATVVATEDNASVARITAQRALHVNLRNNAGTEIATSANPLRIDPTGTTAQPVTDNGGSLTVDGTVTANQGTAGTAVQGWFARLTDGTNNVAVKAASTAAVAADPALVVAVSPNNIVNVNPTKNSTYSASTTGLVSAALATDIFTITGNGTTTVRIKKIRITATRAANGNIDVLLIKRSTANSGGTATTETNVPHDSASAAASSTVRSYTANPTLGTTVGTVRTQKMFVNVIGTGSSDVLDWEFGDGTSQPIVLRGTSQVLAVNLKGVTVATSSFNIYVEWTEET